MCYMQSYSFTEIIELLRERLKNKNTQFKQIALVFTGVSFVINKIQKKTYSQLSEMGLMD